MIYDLQVEIPGGSAANYNLCITSVSPITQGRRRRRDHRELQQPDDGGRLENCAATAGVTTAGDYGVQNNINGGVAGQCVQARRRRHLRRLHGVVHERLRQRGHELAARRIRRSCMAGKTASSTATTRWPKQLLDHRDRAEQLAVHRPELRHLGRLVRHLVGLAACARDGQWRPRAHGLAGGPRREEPGGHRHRPIGQLRGQHLGDLDGARSPSQTRAAGRSSRTSASSSSSGMVTPDLAQFFNDALTRERRPRELLVPPRHPGRLRGLAAEQRPEHGDELLQRERHDEVALPVTRSGRCPARARVGRGGRRGS